MELEGLCKKYEIETKFQGRKVNYYKIPVSAFPFNEDNVSMVNEFLHEIYENTEYSKIKRTKSGGISVAKKSRNFPAYDLRQERGSGIELTVVSWFGSFRLQLRSSSKELFEDKEMKIWGRKAFFEFKEYCLDFGIILEDYLERDIEKAKKIKEQIPAPKICFYNPKEENRLIPKTFECMHHLDFHSSHMSGLVNRNPEFRRVVEYIYNRRKEDDIMFKSILNMTFGYMQSKGVAYGYSALSKDMLEDNNERIEQLTLELIENGYIPYLYNTDGIWYYGKEEPYHGPLEGKGIGKWENDHIGCKFRAKSSGCYEYIENGVYHPVVRGLTFYDRKEPDRTKWVWGDILRNDVIPLMWKVTKEGYIDYVKEEEDNGEETK